MRVRFLPAGPAFPALSLALSLALSAAPAVCVSPAAAQLPIAPRDANSTFDPSTLPLPALADPAPLPQEPYPPHNRPVEPYPTNRYLDPWSRMGVGADISPLGIGIKAAIDANTDMDARFDADFLSISTGRFEIEGVNADANLHMASAAAKLDVYPFGSVWRLSAGLMFVNGNQFSGTTRIAGGASFTLDGHTYYSAKANAATGATPITGSGLLGFHARNPAFIVSGGFGNFVPRAYRHWSFPSEFGVVFTGAPTINVALNGWVCSDKAQTHCADLSNPADPIAIQFNNSLNAQLARWRRSLSNFPIYPVFSYSVVYSFDLP